jgi:pantoate--beta-alanine ligase
MEVIRTADAYAAECHDQRGEVHPIGLVPTMGAFHEGHLSLMRRANAERDFVVVYLFVNPLQFQRGEDFDLYPRNEEQDLVTAEAEGVDLVFAPTVEEMYPTGYPPEVTVDPGPLGDRYEGAARPDHFRGVLTVVARLFDLTGSARPFFGEKDAQQLFLVKQMARELQPDMDIVGCPTIRESDGLAMSSRNVFLKPDERAAAPSLFRGLQAAARLHLGGEKDPNVLKAEIAKNVGAEPLAKLDYVAIVDDATFEEFDAALDRPARALVAATFGTTRLIDNLRLG